MATSNNVFEIGKTYKVFANTETPRLMKITVKKRNTKQMVVDEYDPEYGHSTSIYDIRMTDEGEVAMCGVCFANAIEVA